MELSSVPHSNVKSYSIPFFTPGTRTTEFLSVLGMSIKFPSISDRTVKLPLISNRTV